ncbi:MAG: ATP-binding cassette domain-containing protein [Pseudomonadota bacterium]
MSSSQHADLLLSDVTLALGGREIIHSMSLEIDASRGFALLGESGSGKSTLLGLMIALLRPDSGSLHYRGKAFDYDDLYAMRRKFGYAIQETGLFPHLSVHDNLLLPAKLAGLEASLAQDRIEELAELMNLDLRVLDRYPIGLSGGQQQRAGICRAMMLKPELLLLDEAFSGLDVITRRDVYERFLAMTERDKTHFVLVTHNLDEATRLCERMAVIRDGSLEKSGRCSDLLASPGNDYLQTLIAAQRGLHGRV